MDNFSHLRITGQVKIETAKIMYFQSVWNYTCVHTPEKQHLSSHTLKLLSSKINLDSFIKIHRGLLINISYIHEINWERKAPFVQLKNGKVLPISRRKYNEVVDSLIRIN
ncbi:MAG: LytTR family DNA-binding domain-containing protein [Bacteroidota bacterium]